MKPAEARREAYRCLRACERSMRRSLAEVERLLAVAGAVDAEEVAQRRNLEDERILNPEFLAELAQ